MPSAAGPDPGATLLAIYDDAVVQVYGYLSARCRNRADAEDVTAEVFMGAVDAVWLAMDTPENYMIIEGIMTLDDAVDWERLKAVVQHRLLDRYPVFRQVVVPPTTPMGMPHWEDDDDFALEHHMHHAVLPEPADEAALQAFVEQRMQEPIDRSRPLWHFYLIDGYQGGSVVVSRSEPSRSR